MGEKAKAVREIEFLRPRKLGKWLNVPPLPEKKKLGYLSRHTTHSRDLHRKESWKSIVSLLERIRRQDKNRGPLG